MINLIVTLVFLIFLFMVPFIGMCWDNGTFIKDWRTVWAHRAIWDMTGYGGPEGSYKYEDYAWYEIRFSPSKKKYKVRMEGRTPKKHYDYKIVIDKLNEFYEKSH